MQRNTGYFPTESLEPSGNRLFSRSALNEGDLFRGSLEEIEQQEEQLPPVRTVEDLLDEIGNEQLFDILSKADKLTLEILLMRTEGYNDSEIAHTVGLDKYAVSMRIYRLRKKLEKYF